MEGYGGQILNEASSLLQNVETVSYQLLDKRTPVYTQQTTVKQAHVCMKSRAEGSHVNVTVTLIWKELKI